MRLRNIKNAKETILQNSHVISEPNNYKGKWSQLFANHNPLYLEIGMGKGNFIIENAKKNPNINYIGIEKYASVLIRAIEKLEDIDLPNLKIISFDAEKIDDVFEKEIDLIYLNFSDPWPKNKHAKRRLTSIEFLKRYEVLFKNRKIIHLKTDNEGFFISSIETLSEAGYRLENVTFDLHKTCNDIIMTEYETKFSQKGQNIYYLEAVKQ